MKWEAIIEVECCGYREARMLGGPFGTKEEAISWANHYMELALLRMHQDRVNGKKYYLPWGYNGNRTAYQYDARYRNGLKIPPHCTVYV